MADFSKQWCELNDPEMPHDFDILEEAKRLTSGHYISMICEGFGFIAISKDIDEKIRLYFPDWETDGIDNIGHWIEYEEFISQQKNRVL